MMDGQHADALVFFGATGDLASKQIFPALQAMVRRGHLDVPVIGVAKAGWDLDQLRARARDSLEHHGGVDEAAFAKLSALLCYVDGDYRDPATFERLHAMLGEARRPLHYLAIPPSMFPVVAEGLARSRSARGASAWEWASNDRGDPDVVLAAAGDTPTLDVVAAAALLRRSVPELRVRVVNVVDLFALIAPDEHPHGLDEVTFAELFTVDRPVVFAFHGCPRTIHELVHHRPRPEQFHVRGFIEGGSTTTPFDMTVRNQMSRYDLAMLAVAWAPEQVRDRAGAALAEWRAKLGEHDAYVREHGVDMPEITSWRWGAA